MQTNRDRHGAKRIKLTKSELKLRADSQSLAEDLAQLAPTPALRDAATAWAEGAKAVLAALQEPEESRPLFEQGKGKA